MNNKLFPIAISYGDREYLGSDKGSEEVIKTSAFFESGDSQLFHVPNSGHMTRFINMRILTNIMIGFFNGTLKGYF